MKARSGDLVYFDPPYTVAHAHNGFLKYNERIFSWDDQIRLSKHAHLLASRGCHVVVSNADHPSVRTLYSAFQGKSIQRVSRIAASAAHRGRVTEMVYYSGGG
jgi:DNA adenine methylase